jgi:hypothetical protein
MLHESVTLPVYPLVEVSVTADVDEPPGLTDDGLAVAAASEYVAGGVTVTATVAVCGASEPEVPVIVTVVGPPVVAELLAVNVTVLVVVALVGLNAAVTPLGKPEAARLTLPVNPPLGFTVIVLVLVPLWGTLTAAGDADKVNAAGGVTVTATVAVSGASEPDVPVTVTVVGPPVGAELLAVSVNVVEVVELVGLNAAVTPLGNPEAAKPTLPVKPPVAFTVIVLVLLPLSGTLNVVGEADRVNPGVPEPLGWPDKVTARTSVNFVESVFFSAILWTTRVESSE